MKRQLTRKGKILGAYAPLPIIKAIEGWVAEAPERDKSQFVREAVREKLRREGVHFTEQEVAA